MSDKIWVKKEILDAELFGQILPLAQKCWEESTSLKGESCAYHGDRDYAIEPDLDQYLNLQNHGSLILLTLRDGVLLCGYVVGVLYRCLHHKKILGCLADTLYINPDYRGHTALLVKQFEQESARRGVGIIGWPAHPEGPVFKFLKASGYVPDDVVMEKRLCV